MPAASIAGDACVGAISPSGYADWGGAVVVAGDSVASHPPCAASTTASSHVLLNGAAVTVAGDSATCGHPASGSSHVILE